MYIYTYRTTPLVFCCLGPLSNTSVHFMGKFYSLIEKQCSFFKQKWLAASTNFRFSTYFL